MSRTRDRQGVAGAGGIHGTDVVGRDDRDTRHPDDPRPGSGHRPGAVPASDPYAPGRVTFALSHSHPGRARHSHTFTAVLGYYLTVSIADPHPSADAEALAPTDAEAHTATDAKAHPSADAPASASADPDACTETYDPSPDTDPDPDFDTVFDTKPDTQSQPGSIADTYPFTYPVSLSDALARVHTDPYPVTQPDPDPLTVTDPDL